jgi:hypothetical protein
MFHVLKSDEISSLCCGLAGGQEGKLDTNLRIAASAAQFTSRHYPASCYPDVAKFERPDSLHAYQSAMTDSCYAYRIVNDMCTSLARFDFLVDARLRSVH